MKKSEKILRKNSVPEGLSEMEKQLIRNTTLLEHLINNEMKHLWWWVRVIAIMILSLMARSFFG